jgi:hypothetical protein
MAATATSSVRWIPFASFALAFTLLSLGAGFDLDPFDSAELALVAITRGLGHPPGQPLHTLIGWIVTRGPWPPLVPLALLSIAPMSVALAVFVGDEVGGDRVRAWGAAVVAVAAGCALGAVRDVCSRVEVYALAAALSSVAIYVAARRSTRSDFVSGVLLGLSACANPVVAMQGSGALFLAARGGRWTAIARIVAGGLLGLAPYVYVMSVAGREGDAIVWGAPHDLHGWIALLTARDFQRNVSVSVGAWFVHVGRAIGHFTLMGVVPFVAVGALGLFSRDREGRRRSDEAIALAIALAVGLALIAANAPFLARNPDYGGYLLVPVALATLGIARWIRVRAGRDEPVVIAACLAVAVAAFGSLRARPSGAVRALATSTLAAAPPHALLVLESDHLLFPVLYLQQVESVRRDVTVLNPGWSRSRWAWRFVQAHDPALRVDLTPGLGGDARLVTTISSRAAGRAVLAESLAVLRASAPGPVCPRGVTFSSVEGCGSSRASIAETLTMLRAIRQRSRPGGWERPVLNATAESFASGALALGCPSLADAVLASALGRTVATEAHWCSGVLHAPLPRHGLLQIDDDDLETDRTHAR